MKKGKDMVDQGMERGWKVFEKRCCGSGGRPAWSRECLSAMAGKWSRGDGSVLYKG